MSEVRAEVTFILRDGAEEALFTKAAELDEEVDGIEDVVKYTVPQALQVVWHHDPAWLHGRVLVGWILERAALAGEEMQDIWTLE